MKQRSLTFLLSAFLIALATASSCQRYGPSRTIELGRVEYADLIHQLSEPPGYFWSNNFVSNETSYLHVLTTLDRLRIREGVYVGVGPNQNFSYIANIRPRMAFVVDIRRDNLLEHLMFKVFMERARTRHEYLSLLTGRPIQDRLLGEEASINAIVTSIERATPDASFFEMNLEHLLETLRSWKELRLSATDFRDLERIYGEFYRQGLDIRYDSWRSFFFPTLREFLLETDLDRKHRNWLASEESFRFVRDMQRKNLIIPAIGDFAGERAFRRLGSFLQMRGETVSALYVSNVEFYLFRQRKWDQFVKNVRHLPIDDESVVIRAYANLHRPHPEMVGNHITVTLVHKLRTFLDNAERGTYHSLWDVVTTDYLN
jgi:hypothetical protein